MINPFRKKGGGHSGQMFAMPGIFLEDLSNDPKEIQRNIVQLTNTFSENTDRPHDPVKLMDESRKTIAYWFVVAFILIVAAVLILVPIYNAIVFRGARVITEETTYQPLDVQQILATIGTLLGTPLGFVVGYYFKEGQINRNRPTDSQNG